MFWGNNERLVSFDGIGLWKQNANGGSKTLLYLTRFRVCSMNVTQESPAVAREDALQLIQFLLQYWPWRSSKVDDFYLIRQGVCDFLLVINNNLGPLSSLPRYSHL